MQLSDAFWSLDSDLQLGYEIRDRTYEINSILQAISTAAARNNIIQNDDTTKRALVSLNVLATSVRGSPISFYTELGYAASGRVNNEVWYLNRIKNAHFNVDATLKSLVEMNVLNGLSDVTNPAIYDDILNSLQAVRVLANVTFAAAQNITIDVARLRSSGTSSLTPVAIADAISVSTQSNIVATLSATRKSLEVILAAVEDATSLVGAHGSIFDLLSRSTSRDTASRNVALSGFINNFDRVRNNLLSSITAYRQTAEAGIYNFIRRVQSTYDDSIVRPTFDNLQLPVILSFAKAISTQVYNSSYFAAEFDGMRDSIINSYAKITNETFNDGSAYRDQILHLQKTVFVRNYSSCIDELVTEAQQSTSSISNRYTFCLSERTSGIVVVIPSAQTWLGSIRDSINNILQQLNYCFNGQTSIDARTTTSNCFQYVS